MSLKKKPKPKATKADNSRAETIKEIYLQEDEIRLPQQALNWTAVVIVSLLFGLMAGFFGSWWQIKMQPNWLYTDVSTGPGISEILDLAAQQNDNIKNSFDNITTQNLSNQTVLIYTNNYSASADEWDALYTDDNLQGNGLIVTSDGWIVTTDSVITDVNEDYLIITNDRQGFEVVEFVVDSYNGLVFLKIDKSDLNPITIRTADSVKFGDNLLVLRNTLKFNKPFQLHTKLIAKDFTLIEDSYNFLHSTDKNDLNLVIKDSVGQEFIGSPLANSNGDVIGILIGDNMALSGLNIQITVRNFLSSEAMVNHNSLGANYIDLAEVVGLPANLHQGYNKGALIYGNEELGIDAIVEDGAAARAKIVSGDIILKVNDQLIESGSSLNRLLQEYPLGSTVTLSVLRASGDIEDIIITLDINP
ncbi:serine protease [Patescibacteria group bacterium]|nr:serine protease [Patescibacteria group bacterium]